MGIISTLLTGGSILGKICQTISEAVPFNLETANGICTIRASEASINGVRFTEIKQGDEVKLCAFNTDVDRYACITYPNGYGKTRGGQIFIPPMQTVNLDVGDWYSASTDLPFYVQKIDLRSGAKKENNRVILVFENLTLDETTLEITNTSLTAATDYLQVYFPTAGLGDLMTAEFRSKSGIRTTLRESISAENLDIGVTKYKIPFQIFGFTETDEISGMMQFGIAESETEKIKAAAERQANKENFATVNEHLCRFCGITK